MKQNTVFSPLLALFILAACTKGVGEYGLQPPKNKPESNLETSLHKP